MAIRILLTFVLVGVSGLRSAEVRPFTVDTVLQDLAVSHPEATRVLEPGLRGLSAQEDCVYRQTLSGPLSLDLYRPEGEVIFPAVILVHGGGWLTGSRQMERPMARSLAAKGWVVITVSYRLGKAGRFPAPVHDLKAAVRWLRHHAQEWHLDPSRIAIVGGSAGGTLAVTVGATNGLPDLAEDPGEDLAASEVQAVINIDGSVCFADNALIRMAEERPLHPYWEYVHGPFREHRAVWVAASPLFYTGAHCPPMLFLSSSATQPIRAGREEMVTRLRLLGVRAERKDYPNTPHPFWLVSPWFEDVVTDCDRFLSEVLKAPPS